MSRSLKKGPFVCYALLNKIKRINKKDKCDICMFYILIILKLLIS